MSVSCDDCEIASGGRAHPLEWVRFNPACVECGARAICFVRRMKTVDFDQRSRRMTAIVEEWVKFGHSEEQLRELATRDWKAWAEWAHDRSRHRPRA